MRPKTSIIIRVYNNARTVERSIRSALAQDCPREAFEVMIIDDGSTDESARIIDAFAREPNVRIMYQENQGPTRAANRGLAESRGEYVTLLDSDDTFEPSLVRELSALLDARPDVDFVYSDYYEINTAGERGVVRPAHIFETIAIGILFRADTFRAQGFYREGVFFGEYDLLLRTLDIWNGEHVPKMLFSYYRREGSQTGSSECVRKGIGQLKEMYPDKESYIDSIRTY